MKRARRLAAIAVVLALVPAPVHAHAPATDVDAARVELEAGLAAYERKEFAAAQAHFERAHGLDPTPSSLYAWAQAARGAGDCATAVELYRRFIDEGATGDSREAAEKNEARCREILASAPPPAVVEPPPPADVAPAPAPVVDPSPTDGRASAPRRKPDVAGIALVSVGAAAIVGGAVSIGVGEALRAEQADTRDYDRFDELDPKIDALHIAGGVVLGVGVVLAVVGAVRLGLARRRDRHVASTPRFGRTTGMLGPAVGPRG